MGFMSKKETLTISEIQKISISAIISKQQQDRYKQSASDEFYTLPTTLGRKSRKDLRQSWDIVDGASACSQLEWLLLGGFRNFALSLEEDEVNFEKAAEISEKLVNAGLLCKGENLLKKDLTAWDMGRLVFLARSCLENRFIGQETAWYYIEKAYQITISHFHNWDEFADSYLIGRVLQADRECEMLEYFLYAVKWLKQHPSSPWVMVDLM